jgi:hypothetical protein
MTSGRKSGISKLKPVVIIGNAALVAAYLLLVILFFALPTTAIFSCLTPPSQRQPRSAPEIVSIVYKVFFGLVSAGLAVTFAVYGIRIIQMMQETKNLAAKNPNAQAGDLRRKALIRVSEKKTFLPLNSMFIDTDIYIFLSILFQFSVDSCIFSLHCLFISLGNQFITQFF